MRRLLAVWVGVVVALSVSAVFAQGPSPTPVLTPCPTLSAPLPTAIWGPGTLSAFDYTIVPLSTGWAVSGTVTPFGTSTPVGTATAGGTAAPTGTAGPTSTPAPLGSCDSVDSPSIVFNGSFEGGLCRWDTSGDGRAYFATVQNGGFDPGPSGYRYVEERNYAGCQWACHMDLAQNITVTVAGAYRFVYYAFGSHELWLGPVGGSLSNYIFGVNADTDWRRFQTIVSLAVGSYVLDLRGTAFDQVSISPESYFPTATPTAAPAAVLVVVDGDFEANPVTGWEDCTGYAGCHREVAGHAGFVGQAWAGCCAGTIGQHITLTANTAYSYSYDCYYRADNNTDFHFTAPGGFSGLAMHCLTPVGGGWTHATGTWTTPNYSGVYWFYMTDSDGVAVDNIGVTGPAVATATPGPTATSGPSPTVSGTPPFNPLVTITPSGIGGPGITPCGPPPIWGGGVTVVPGVCYRVLTAAVYSCPFALCPTLTLPEVDICTWVIDVSSWRFFDFKLDDLAALLMGVLSIRMIFDVFRR